MICTQITDEEYYQLYNLSVIRLETNIQNNIKNQKRDPKQNDVDITFLGAIGEYAFCKFFNLTFDKTTQSRSGGADCEMKGYRIDVKSSKWKGEYVYVKYKEYPYVDIFAFCYVKGKFVEILGYQFVDFVINPNNLANGHKGPCYRIKVKNLHKFKTYVNP